MLFVAWLVLLVVLAIGLVPVWLLRHARREPARDYLRAAYPTRPAVVRNASIAYALRMAAFVPLFAWGASGDLWPPIIASACFGLGTWLVYVVRRPLVEFVDDALAHERSVTVHAFIAREYGNDSRVRVIAASMTVCALFGLVVAEIFAAAAVLGPMLEPSRTLALLLTFAAVAAIATTVALSGHSGVMHSAQLQLGLLYFGLFGATALVLYLHISARTTLRPHVALATAFIAAFGAILLWYRRSRYVDTDTIRSDERSSASRTARTLARFGKILNGVLSALLVLIVVVAVLDLQAAGVLNVAHTSAAALTATTQMPGTALLAIALLALCYPLVDVTNWIRLAALRKTAAGDPPAEHATMRNVFAIYAIESALMGLFVCALGAIAGVALTPSGGEFAHAFAVRLAAADNAIEAIASMLLAICALAAALTTITALLAAGLVTLHDDVLARIGPSATPAEPSMTGVVTLRRRTLVAALVALGMALVVAGTLAWTSLRDELATVTLSALLSVLCAVQISLAPLVVGALVAHARSGHEGVTRNSGQRMMTPGWAVATLASGAGSAVAAVITGFATGTETWLWWAVPASLGAGLVAYALGRAAAPRS